MEKFTFFWKSKLSQWNMTSFTVDDLEYNCAEQYMMYQKAIFFNDTSTAKKIHMSNDPREQKALGRQVKGFIEEEWNKVARDIVYKGNYHRFKQNPELYTILKSTAGTTLVEASPFDAVWGIKLAADDSRAQKRETWRGKNWLGETLTKVRDDLMREEDDQK